MPTKRIPIETYAPVTRNPTSEQPSTRVTNGLRWRWCKFHEGHWYEAPKAQVANKHFCSEHSHEFERLREASITRRGHDATTRQAREDHRWNSLHKFTVGQVYPPMGRMLTDTAPHERSWPMIENECPHDRCSGDSTPPCGCYPEESQATEPVPARVGLAGWPVRP